MNGIIFELEEKSKYTGRYMDGEISYNNTSIDYTKEIRECDRKSEIKDLLNDPCLGKIFEKGEVDDEIIYNGNIEDVKEEWMRAIQIYKRHLWSEEVNVIDENRQEMDAKHLDCLVPIRKLELQEYLSPEILKMEHI